MFYACSPGLNKREEPENLVPIAKMTTVVQEMVVMEAHIKSKIPSVAKFNQVMVNSGDSILTVNGITREQYKSSLKYYAQNQVDLMEIYSEALDNLNEEQALIENEKN